MFAPPLPPLPTLDWGPPRDGVPGRVVAAAVYLVGSAVTSIAGGLFLVLLAGTAPLPLLAGVLTAMIGAVMVPVAAQVRRLVPSARGAAVTLAVADAVLSVLAVANGSYLPLLSLPLDAFVFYLLIQDDAMGAFRRAR